MTVVREFSFRGQLMNTVEETIYFLSGYICMAILYIMLEARDNPVNQSAGSVFFLLREE